MMQEELSYWISFICQTCGFDDIASLLPLYGSWTSKSLSKSPGVREYFCDEQIRTSVTDKNCNNLQGQGMISIKNIKRETQGWKVLW